MPSVPRSRSYRSEALWEGIAPGEHQVQATLRYQACNESVCFAPARATAQWTITVNGAD